MDLPLERLPEALTRQFENVVEGARDVPAGIKWVNSREYAIDGLAVRVFVNMSRRGKERAAPKGAVICSMPKMCQDKAKVTIVPENEGVKAAVCSHFKAQVIPPMMMSPARPLFDEVIINNDRLIFLN